jgi:hypothetical protein
MQLSFFPNSLLVKVNEINYVRNFSKQKAQLWAKIRWEQNRFKLCANFWWYSLYRVSDEIGGFEVI